MYPICFLAFLIFGSSQSNSFPCRVISIHDGDSITVLKNNRQIKVRLEGIDCPELSQPFGRKARSQTSKLSFGKNVKVNVTGKDRYGRTLGTVILPDGTNVNQELVKTGYAWWFRKYSRDQVLKKLEEQARKNNRGLWSDKNAISPWDWRAKKRSRTPQVPDKIKVISNGVAIVGLLPNPDGIDRGRERVWIKNSTAKAVDLNGWFLVDRAGNRFGLHGRIGAGKTLVITMTIASMPLNNDGDDVVLIDSQRICRSRVWYSRSQGRSGRKVSFPH